MGWVVNATPRPLYPPKSTHCVEDWMGSEPVWTGEEYLAPTGIRSPDHPACSEWLLCYMFRSYTRITIRLRI